MSFLVLIQKWFEGQGVCWIVIKGEIRPVLILFIDRKCDHCGNRRIRYPASDLSLERHPELYPFGSMGKCIGSCGVVDAGRTCSLEYDEKCRDQRGTGADRTGRNTDYLLCKENSV